MIRPPSQDGISQAARRPLRIFASDPQAGRTFGNRSSIEVVNERLSPGPVGPRLEVIDYDGSQQCFYKPVDLDNRAILMHGGLEPSESDPRFHQQMVYAVARKTLENFDRALGRILTLGSQNRKRGAKYPRLRLFPHAFYGTNAFYNKDLNAILFGYFKAEAADVGPNLPHQTVFTCLSHDIIAHEMTHAIVDRLRPLFLEPSNMDVRAFHEGFADIVAIFQHFSFQDILSEHIQSTRSDITKPNPLVELAQQFGQATGSGKALRSALDKLDKPDPKLYGTTFEPHDRGSILVAAVFDGFNKTYQRRIADLARIATGGTGTLPQGDLHPDLVKRIADEAALTAQRVLDMCIRAFEYMPPVDVTFGDFLRAMVTADYELAPKDEYNFRGAMIEAFRIRGIYPKGVISLAEESLLWPKAEKLPHFGKNVRKLLEERFFSAVRDFDESWQKPDDWRGYDPKQTCVICEEEEDIKLDVSPEMAKALHDYATDNADALGLDRSAKIQVRGFHPIFRVSPRGRLLIELNAQFAQVDRSVKGQLGGIPFRGGCTLVASSDGDFRYLISKPMLKAGGDGVREQMGKERFADQQEYLQMCDMQNALMPYITDKENQERMLDMMNFANLC
jgi:hypothetical protein